MSFSNAHSATLKSRATPTCIDGPKLNHLSPGFRSKREPLSKVDYLSRGSARRGHAPNGQNKCWRRTLLVITTLVTGRGGTAMAVQCPFFSSRTCNSLSLLRNVGLRVQDTIFMGVCAETRSSFYNVSRSGALRLSYMPWHSRRREKGLLPLLLRCFGATLLTSRPVLFQQEAIGN